MPVPIVKSEATYYSTPGITMFKRTSYTQNGLNLKELSGTVATDYSTTRGFTTSMMRYKSDNSPFAYDCMAQFGGGLLGFNKSEYGPLRNRAYAKFKDEATGDQSQVGTAFAEWKQSLDLVTSNALAIRNNWLAFKRGRWAKYTAIKINPRRGTGRLLHVPRNIAEGAAAAWLQFWFGIAPLAGDITTSLNQASDPIPSNENYQGTARKNIFERSGTTIKVEIDGLYRVAVGGQVRITNPNLYLAAQLGLVNPAQIAYEITPFSFLADWAFDIASFIESFSDFVGCEITKAYWNEKASGTTAVSGTYWHGKWVAHQVNFVRKSGLYRPTPNFQVQANLGTSLTRAASAASLLVQAFRAR